MTAVVAPAVGVTGPTIPKEGPAELGLDQRRLHSLGLEYVRRLSHKIWTDYNVHDPGYTAIEIASFALTELTSRANWPVEDLIASTGGGSPIVEPLFTARQILPGRPLTALDYRKLLIDLPHVKNAWIVPAEEQVYVDSATGEVTRDPQSGPGIHVVPLRGLYRILLEFMDDSRKEQQEEAIAAATARFHENRNLCEDLVEVVGIERQFFRICGEIDIAPDADASQAKAAVLFAVQRYLAPPVFNYTLAEMLERTGPRDVKYSVDEIFDGPALETGFYDDRELESAALRTEIRLSDIIALVMQVPGVRAVRELLIVAVGTGKAEEKWVVPVLPQRLATLIDVVPPNRRPPPFKDQSGSRLVFFKRHLPIVPPEQPTRKALDEMVRNERKRLELTQIEDIPVPVGRDRKPESYYSIQNHFPAVYGIGEDDLSLDGIPETQRPRRLAQVKQLQGYLLFLDQIMANFCRQLAGVGNLFSADDQRHTYFAQKVDLRDAEALYPAADPVPIITPLMEEEEQAVARRNVFLNHLIARFAEQFHEYASMMHSLFQSDPAGLIGAKVRFLIDYPRISAERGLAFDYTRSAPADLWDTQVVSGLEQRVGRLLDIRDLRRRNLSDVVEDAFALVVADGPEFVWEITDRHTPAAQLLRSRGKFATRGEARAALRDALRQGQQPGNYDIKEAADGRFFFNLLGSDGGVLAQQTFATEEECEAAVRRLLSHMVHWYAEEGLYLIENILLRMRRPGDPPLPVCPEPGCTDCAGDDPYSWRLHLILPAYAGRFATMEFRRFVEDTIREECPAHLLPKICWIGREDMGRLEVVYREWLGILSGESKTDRTAKLQAFIDTLYRVKNVYPAGRLKACVRGEDPERFLLGRSALGTMSPRES